MQDGRCKSCDSGWNGSTCDTNCAAGWFGLGCVHQCSRNCKQDASCNRVYGLCDNGCSDEWIGTFCEVEKVVTFKDRNVSQSTTYPGIIYDARYAVDKDVSTCARTEVIGTTSGDKSVWWRMDLGVMSIVQRVNILFKNYNGYVYT
uniref:Scavenger receptor class F member 1-like n=1 Tax=Crassostrea virginica TaxID=6565 RepID=A0A8B8BX91_CRAVI|nr:scavenger receptor class F member 1-like [Crassostrea virginica]